MEKKLIIVGGGAAGFFAAINAAERNPDCKVTILEKTQKLLTKVKVSGGGRCNVTNTISEPEKLVSYYPRGSKELRSPFFHFSSNDTVKWFEKRGIKLKTEPDGRIFPVSNDSMTIVNCLLSSAEKAGIDIVTGAGLKNLIPGKQWTIETSSGNYAADKLLLATGSNEITWNILTALGHKVELPVPSLFTFNIKDKRINHLSGISLKNVEIKAESTSLKTNGDLLITHWGLSGPAVLKLSAWGAREFHNKKYNFTVIINWINKNPDEVRQFLSTYKNEHPGKNVFSNSLFNIPIRLWEKLSEASGINTAMNWNSVSKQQFAALVNELTSCKFNVTGKSTFKEEFVTCGGVNLKEVNFKTMESKLHKELYFAGEVLDIDAITGGFNFQAAWTTAWIASEALSQ